MKLQLPADALGRFKTLCAGLNNRYVGQRSLNTLLSSELLAEHGLSWAEVVDAAFDRTPSTSQEPQSVAACSPSSGKGEEKTDERG